MSAAAAETWHDEVCLPTTDQVLNGYVVTITCSDGSEAIDFITERDVARMYRGSGFGVGPAVTDSQITSITLHDCTPLGFPVKPTKETPSDHHRPAVPTH